MRIFKSMVIIILFTAFSAATAVWLEIREYARVPTGTSGSDTQVVTIQTGEALASVCTQLERRGIISDPLKFRLLARLQGTDTAIKAGEFLLSATMTPADILKNLTQGKVILHRLTIPEGFTLAQIAHSAAAAGLAPEAEFIDQARNPALSTRFGIPVQSFEGYLFPETYYFPKTTDAQEIITTMATRFETVFTPGWQQRARDLGMTRHQVVTLASIIEKECAVPDERPLVSSVFHNRLKRGMRLQSDPTVIYGIADFDGNLTRQHLTTTTPYNTYRIKGLPPGPIANPGKGALEAALFPAQSTYLYFVSKRNRTHHFATHYRDHQAAVRKYQLGK